MMYMSILELLSLAVSAAATIIVTAVFNKMSSFIDEQKKVNESNALANRSLQRDVLFRYFSVVVEQGQAITPDEMDHIDKCYNAYHMNGGNGTGTAMYEKIKRHAKIITGRN